MRRTERVAYRTKFYSNLSSPTRFDEEPFLYDQLMIRIKIIFIGSITAYYRA